MVWGEVVTSSDCEFLTKYTGDIYFCHSTQKLFSQDNIVLKGGCKSTTHALLLGQFQYWWIGLEGLVQNIHHYV